MKIIKKYLNLGIFALFLLLILSACSLNQGALNENENSLPIDEEVTNETGDGQLIGGDKDEHGCLIAAGYSWCEPKQKCLRTWEEECIISVSQNNLPKQFASIADSVSWAVYQNEEFDYSVTYPDIANVAGDDLSQKVEFIGPLKDSEWWPRLSVSHYNSEFYHPPKGTDVKEWVKMFPGYTLGEERTISGLPALHFVQLKGQANYAADYYYFIKDAQLYQITLLHSSDHEDWPLYNKFLDSFKFLENQLLNCQTNADCVPMPGCHPRECINSQYVGNYPQPDVCTELFDCQAAYKVEDCACQAGICNNINIGNNCVDNIF